MNCNLLHLSVRTVIIISSCPYMHIGVCFFMSHDLPLQLLSSPEESRSCNRCSITEFHISYVVTKYSAVIFRAIKLMGSALYSGARQYWLASNSSFAHNISKFWMLQNLTFIAEINAQIVAVVDTWLLIYRTSMDSRGTGNYFLWLCTELLWGQTALWFSGKCGLFPWSRKKLQYEM